LLKTGVRELVVLRRVRRHNARERALHIGWWLHPSYAVFFHWHKHCAPDAFSKSSINTL